MRETKNAPRAGGEKRRAPRFDVDDVTGSLTLALDVRVRNLSVSGMAVETSAQLTVGRRYRFRLRYGETDLPLAGRVSWSFLASTRHNESGEIEPVYRAGIEFEDMLTDRARQLMRLLERRAVLGARERVFGRFPVTLPGGIEIDRGAEFQVRRISLSGMLIESPLVPEKGDEFDAELKIAGRILPVRLRVAYVELVDRSGDTVGARTGVEFIGLDESARQAIERFLGETFGGTRH